LRSSLALCIKERVCSHILSVSMASWRIRVILAAVCAILPLQQVHATHLPEAHMSHTHRTQCEDLEHCGTQVSGAAEYGNVGLHTALLLTSATVRGGNSSIDYVSCASTGAAVVAGVPLPPGALNATVGAPTVQRLLLQASRLLRCRWLYNICLVLPLVLVSYGVMMKEVVAQARAAARSAGALVRAARRAGVGAARVRRLPQPGPGAGGRAQRSRLLWPRTAAVHGAARRICRQLAAA